MSPPKRHVASFYMKLSEYDLTQKTNANFLGRGSFGDVYKIPRNYRGKKTEVAMKFMNAPLNTPQAQRDYIREVEILSCLSHPTLLPLIGYTIPNEQGVLLATPYMKNGNLHEVMKKVYQGGAPDGWDDTKKSCCALGIAVGMMIIHKKKYNT